ncbi:MAG: hypothetical protein NVV66_18710 [Cellulomonas sp.]|uniref:hypothetical protein n=1 Tax=Cellulomonas sp. TaxID=40001 RepID=UPI00258697F3|nr:hypothetical protein [Cellulomonas sp.]MCR6706628.1 hypothetical protein [Cellulomonas sp.]
MSTASSLKRECYMDTVRFFKDHAKFQLKGAREGAPHATALLAGLRHCAEQPTLQQVQHHVAVTAGYSSWAGLLEAPERDRQLAVVMTREPQLTRFGMGAGAFHKTREERLAAFARGRAELRASADDVAEVTTWLLANIAPIRTVNRVWTSYQHKHMVERVIDRYVANGELIAAAIIAGYAYRRDAWDSPNVCFAMSSRSVRAARALGERQRQDRFPR